MSYLPPEVIAGQLTAGPGAAPMEAAATSYRSSAEAYQSLAGSVEAHSQRLVSNWSSAASLQLRKTTPQLVSHLQQHGAALQKASAQATTQAQLFTTARNSIVPLPTITANRTESAILQATNYYGQNSAKIAKLQAQYTEYTVQNNTVLETYRAGTDANTTFTPVEQPPHLVSAVAPDPGTGTGTGPGKGGDQPNPNPTPNPNPNPTPNPTPSHTPSEFMAWPGGMAMPSGSMPGGTGTGLTTPHGVTTATSPTLTGLGGKGIPSSTGPIINERVSSYAGLPGASPKSGIRTPTSWKSPSPGVTAPRTSGFSSTPTPTSVPRAAPAPPGVMMPPPVAGGSQLAATGGGAGSSSPHTRADVSGGPTGRRRRG